MSDPIKKGDLVALVKPCPYCGCGSDIGMIFVAGRILLITEPTDCCGNTSADYIIEDGHPDGGGQLLRCCIKIPPMSELEGQRTEEDLREPA